jgi:hypothetical protein
MLHVALQAQWAPATLIYQHNMAAISLQTKGSRRLLRPYPAKVGESNKKCKGIRMRAPGTNSLDLLSTG